MQVPVNGHPLPLLPALDRRHVAVEVRRDFLPRIQPVFGRSHGWRCAKGWFAHRALLIGPQSSTTRESNCSLRLAKARQNTAFDGKLRNWLQFCALPLVDARRCVRWFPSDSSKLKI